LSKQLISNFSITIAIALQQNISREAILLPWLPKKSSNCRVPYLAIKVHHMNVMGCLHDPANVQQMYMYSKYTC